MAVALAAAVALIAPATMASAQVPDPDPRIGLDPGVFDAEEASWNMELIDSLPKPTGYYDPGDWGAARFRNSDMAFGRDHAFVGSYNGALIYDISDPYNTELRTALVCPGGQGDISVHKNLMFISVQELGTEDCQPLGTEGSQRLVGMRIFDISDLDMPRQVATVQTCRGSHTHTVVSHPDDEDTVWIYVNGTSGVRNDGADVGLDCQPGPLLENGRPSSDPADHMDEDGNPVPTSRYQIEVIEVPMDSPEDAEIVSEPKIFQDYETGNPVGLRGQSDACHDITSFPELGIAACAGEGNGLLLDITDPVNPVRIDDVADEENFAYWHSAIFSNDGSKVVFTDELGGGGRAVCTPEDHPHRGANAIFDIVEDDDGNLRMEFRSYYKVPNIQTATENCVAHNGSMIPIPGRDIMVQSWYQGGITVFDFTDSENPQEIAFFDRGPIDEDRLVLGGQWSAYYYNGFVYAPEIVRGFDVLELTASDFISQDELDTAAAVRMIDFSPQHQYTITEAHRNPCAGVDAPDFPDTISDAHRGNVSCGAGFGIAQGFADGTFRPLENVRRDQTASFIHRMMRVAGVDMPDAAPDRFSDITVDAHRQAINELAELGIVNGTTATTFEPTAPITRAQTTSLIVRAVEYILDRGLDAPRSPFTDVPSAWAHTANIDAAYGAGLVTGTTSTTFAPNDNIRRDQVSSLISRSLRLLHHELIELRPL